MLGVRSNTTHRLRRDRRGETWVEYLILIAVLALGLLGAFRALASKLGDAARREGAALARMDSLASELSGSPRFDEPSLASGTEPPKPPKPPPPKDAVPAEFKGMQPCLVESYQATSRESYTLGTLYRETGKAFEHDRLSNGTERIYEGVSRGEGFDVGAAVVIPIGGMDVALTGGIMVGGATSNGFVWLLDDAEQRAKELALRQAIAVDAYVNAGQLPDFSDAQALERNASRAVYMQAMKHQNVDRVLTKVGASGTVSLGADAFGLSAEQVVGAGVTKSVEQDRDGTTSVSYEINAAASSELGALFFGEYMAGQEASFTVAVTTDSTGVVTDIELTGIQGIKVGSNADGDTARLQSAVEEAAPPSYLQQLGKLGKLGDSLSSTFEYTDRDEASGALRTSVHIDPRRVGDSASLRDFLRSPTPEGVRALAADLPPEASTVDVQLYRGQQHTEDLTIKAQLILGAGGSSTSAQKKLQIVDAWTLSTDGLKHRTDCVR